MKKRGEKKTNKDEKRGWHPNTLSSVFSCRLNTQTHEVEVLGTLHSQTLCVCFGNPSQQTRGKVKTQSKHTQCVAFGFCVVRKTVWETQTIRSVKVILTIIDKTTNHDLSSHDGKTVNIHSTSVVFGASGHLWCHEERCANTTCHGHACLHRLHCSCFSKV